MPAQVLQAIHTFTNLAAGVSLSIAHGLHDPTGKGYTPNIVLPDRACSIRCTADATNVTYTNFGANAVSANFLVQYQHSMQQSSVSPVSLLYNGNVDLDGAGPCSILSYGADPTGVANSHDAIQSAINACSDLYFPAGSYRCDGTPIVIPSGTSIQGASCESTEIFTEQASAAIFRLQDAEQASVGNLTLRRDTAGHAAYGNGLEIRGASSEISIQRVRIQNCFRGVQVGEETDAQTVGDVLLFDVRTDHDDVNLNSSQYGFDLEECQRVRLIDCASLNNWLDGIKLRVLTQDTEIRGGEFAYNGWSSVGDGIDTYIGGSRLMIVGGEWHHNGVGATNPFVVGEGGAGINIKTGPLTLGGAQGYTRDISVIGARCHHNYGAGIVANRSSAAVDTDPLPNCVTISGCISYSNGQHTTEGYGLYIRARNVSVHGGVYRDNQRNGIYVASKGYDVTIHGPTCVANGLETAATFDQLQIVGARVRVFGGIYNCKNSDDLRSDADYAALPQVGRYGIRIDGSDVVLDSPVCLNPSVGTSGLSFAAGSTNCFARYVGTGDPNGVYQGGIGSIYQRFDGVQGTAVYVKEQTAPNSSLGWNPITNFELVPEAFYQDNVAAGQANVDLAARVSGNWVNYQAIRGGSIVGLRTRLTEAITDANDNSLIVTVTINGAPGTLLVSHKAGSNQVGGRATQATGIDTYVAGDLIGVELTTLGTFAPATTDLEAVLEVAPDVV